MQESLTQSNGQETWEQSASSLGPRELTLEELFELFVQSNGSWLSTESNGQETWEPRAS